MFNFKKYTPIITELSVIHDGYLVLHFDQEPILFTGFNNLGNRVLASSVEVNLKKRYELFFHSLIEESSYANFIHRRITYKDILSQKAQVIFLIKKYFSGESETFLINHSDIPREYVPLDSSFCPAQNYLSSLLYEVKYGGLKADLHQGTGDDVKETHIRFASIVDNAIKATQTKDTSSVNLQAGFVKSSFQLNFNIDIQPKPNIKEMNQQSLYKDSVNYEKFIRDFLDYAFNNLKDDVECIASNDGYSEQLKNLMAKARGVYLDSGKILHANFDKNFIKSLQDVASDLSDIAQLIGKNFSRMTFVNLAQDGKEDVLASINNTFKAEIETAVNRIEELSSTITKDSSPKEYKILVYHFNKLSRSGNAYVQKDEKTFWQPKFKVGGDKHLEGSIFTESLHENKIVTVDAIGTKDGDKLKSLLIKDF
jgi:hypothetical protein